MPVLTKGANAPIAALSVTATLSWRSHAADDSIDVAALLLTASGQVRNDDDFIFYNQPMHASGSVNHAGRKNDSSFRDAIDVHLSRTESVIDRIVVIASIDAGSFADVQDLQLEISSPSESIQFAISDCTTEAALVVGELYRRGEQWKFRAIGQGYDSGLAGVARDFGITVDETPPEPSVRLAPAPPIPQPAAIPLPSPTQSSVTSAQISVPDTPVDDGSIPWYKANSDFSVDMVTTLPLREVALSFRGVIEKKSRKARFDSVQQLTDPFDQFDVLAEFAVVAIAQEYTKAWAVQIYVYELGDRRGVTLRAVGQNAFARITIGPKYTLSKTAGRKKAAIVIEELRRLDPHLEWVS